MTRLFLRGMSMILLNTLLILYAGPVSPGYCWTSSQKLFDEHSIERKYGAMMQDFRALYRQNTTEPIGARSPSTPDTKSESGEIFKKWMKRGMGEETWKGMKNALKLRTQQTRQFQDKNIKMLKGVFDDQKTTAW